MRLRFVLRATILYGLGWGALGLFMAVGHMLIWCATGWAPMLGPIFPYVIMIGWPVAMGSLIALDSRSRSVTEVAGGVVIAYELFVLFGVALVLGRPTSDTFFYRENLGWIVFAGAVHAAAAALGAHFVVRRARASGD